MRLEISSHFEEDSSMKLVKHMMSLILGVVLCAHIAVHAQSDARLVEPGPIAIPENSKPYTLDEIRKAILTSALRNQWRIESETPGTIQIVLDGRNDHAVLVMDVIYDVKSYSIKYVRSEKLRYVKGTGVANACPSGQLSCSVNAQQEFTTIHSSYARWMKNLTESISSEFKILRL
jgi:hypothetical protein